MRPLIIGILLFLIWSSLSVWYYSQKIFSISEPVEETTIVTEAPEKSEAPDVTADLPDKPDIFTLYFDYNQTSVQPSDPLNTFIKNSLNYLLADSAACLLITGHTCSKGNEEYNNELGMKRAVATKEYLKKNGFSASCLKVNSKGENEPVADNSREEGRKLNRRVSLEILTR